MARHTEPGTPTLDQLRLFTAVVDHGSFGAAARRLNRAVSVVSYGIANLEAQLGVRLFEREGTRKPQLTAAGKARGAGASGACAEDVTRGAAQAQHFGARARRSSRNTSARRSTISSRPTRGRPMPVIHLIASPA